MNIDEVKNLKKDDEEFQKGLNLDNIINNEDLNKNPSNVNNPHQFQTDSLRNYNLFV